MNLTETIEKLVENYPDEYRHSLVAESSDWEKITPVLVASGDIIGIASESCNRALLVTALRFTRVIVEVVYVST